MTHIRSQPHATAKHRDSLHWAGYAAATWSFIFAIVHFYWSLGGTAGIATLGGEIERMARERTLWFIIVAAWGVAILKTLAGVVALAGVQTWGQKIPRWFLLLATWGIGILFTLYGLAGLVQRSLMVSGAIRTPDDFPARWHLFLWDPWWILGGILFLLAALHLTRVSPRAHMGRHRDVSPGVS